MRSILPAALLSLFALPAAAGSISSLALPPAEVRTLQNAQREPSIAAGANGYLMAWIDEHALSGPAGDLAPLPKAQIYAMPFDRGGAPRLAASVPIGETDLAADRARSVDVLWNGSEYIVAKLGTFLTLTRFAADAPQTTTAIGIGSAGFPVTSGSMLDGAFNGSTYVCTWKHEAGIAVLVLDAGFRMVAASTFGNGLDSQPRIATDGTMFLITTIASGALRATTVTASGVVTQRPDTLARTSAHSLVCGAAGFVAAWGENGVKLARLDAAGTPIGEPLAVPAMAFVPLLAATADGLLAAWAAHTPGRIDVLRLAPDGTPRGDVRTVAALTTATLNAIAANDLGASLAWSSNGTVVTAVLDSEAASIRDPLTITHGIPSQLGRDIAVAHGVAGMIWTESRTARFAVANRLGLLRPATDMGSGLEASIYTDGEIFYLFWRDLPPRTMTLRRALPDGTFIDDAAIDLGFEEAKSIAPADRGLVVLASGRLLFIPPAGDVIEGAVLEAANVIAAYWTRAGVRAVLQTDIPKSCPRWCSADLQIETALITSSGALADRRMHFKLDQAGRFAVRAAPGSVLLLPEAVESRNLAYVITEDLTVMGAGSQAALWNGTRFVSPDPGLLSWLSGRRFVPRAMAMTGDMTFVLAERSELFAAGEGYVAKLHLVSSAARGRASAKP